MALSDLVTSLPGLILVATLPGVALASLLVPRWPWWQWLAAAPGLSAGMIGVLGLLYHDLGVPFEPLTVLPVLLAVVGAAAGVRVLGRGRFLDERRRQHLPGWPTAVVIAAALFAGGLSAGVATSELGRIALPFATDAPVHAFVAEKAAQTHDVLPVQPVPANGSGVVRPRTGFESTAVAVSWVAGPRPAMTMLPLALLAVLLLPLSLAMLAVEAILQHPPVR